MPPRWLCVLIVLCWLSLNGWLFWQELLPQLLPGQPPPYSVDLVEEARGQRSPTLWTVSQNDREVFLLRTRVEHPLREIYELTADYRPIKGTDMSAYGLRLSQILSTYRVTSQGDLLGLEVRYAGAPELPVDFLQGPFEATLAGDVVAGKLLPTLSLKSQLVNKKVEMSELNVGRGGGVILPLHPPRRMIGLRPGQTWRTALLDPIPDSIVALSGLANEVRMVAARVRPVVEEFTSIRYPNAPCLVIDYEGDRVKVTTWVRREDGVVLGQEAKLGNARWTIHRH